ncbi:hypothetical protein RJ639_007857 [Escallonia herrerae]|uniref:Integrase catalytic domain-containing protein n=1 Tax=Escallonia herrerae TaxID=1293975 RepID=A0AA88VWZ0_9ASTE|nr:hypothetical protein RJ639_007857 [Escallonia herrerae]
MAQGRSIDHAASKNKGRSKSQSKARKLKCYYCHKEGHYRKDYLEHKGKKKDNSKMANTGVVEDNYDGTDVLSVTISSSDGGWILDTGCSYHMCPNRDWFATYRLFDGGKVLMGNDVTCKVVGIGSIQIRMHDGIVRTLIDVRHVNTVTGAAVTALSSVYIDSDTTKLWHIPLGHMSERGMDVLSKQGLLGSKKTKKLDFCEHCVFRKQCRVKFSWAVHTTKGTFKMMIEKKTGKEIKCLKTENGMEFYLDEFTEFCKNEGIVTHHTVRKMPQQNGIVEHMNRILLERARCMLSNVGFPSTAIDCKTPEEVWSDKHANYKHLRIFGCPAYAHVNNGKLEPRAKKCIFLGYANGVKGYRLWCPDSELPRFLIITDMTFNESLMLSKKELIDARKDQGIREKVELEVRAPDSLTIIPTDKEDGSHSTEENEEPQEQQYNIIRNRQRREIRPPQKYGYTYMVTYALSVAENIEVEEPATYKEAIKSMESAQWTVDMSEEMESLYKNQIWKATLQTIVALSTTEAECIAATKAVKEAIWLKGLVGDLGLKQESSTIYCDSQSAIHLTKTQMLHERTKHIDIRFHFIRDVVSQDTVMVKKIFTDENPVDMMTKHIPEIKTLGKVRQKNFHLSNKRKKNDEAKIIKDDDIFLMLIEVLMVIWEGD